MKTSKLIGSALIASSALGAAAADTSDDSLLNHVTFSARFGLNIKARFGPRVAPGGGQYNYLDGYVLTDSTGNFDPTSTFPGLTQFWGYDNSARQRDATPSFTGDGVNGKMGTSYPTIGLTRGLAGTDPGSSELDNEAGIGGELCFTRELGRSDNAKWRWGAELGVSFMNLCLSGDNNYSGTGTQGYFPYFSGTPLPTSPTGMGQPFQGTFDGANFGLIGDTVIGSASVPLIITGRNSFEADIWGFRAGPYLQRSLGKDGRGELNLSAGLALALVNARSEWNQTLTINGVTDPTNSGNHRASDLLWGYYVSGSFTWYLSDQWAVNAGVQFQDIGSYRDSGSGRVVELDMSKSVYITVGFSFSF